MNIGEKIKYYRLQQNISMQELARRAGVAQSGISDFEANKKQPNFDTLNRIISSFNISLAEFFNEEEPTFTPTMRELIKNSEKLTNQQLEALIQVAKAMNN